MSMIYNKTIEEEYIPDKLKLAHIRPLYKKGNIHLLENYRPISLLPVLSKIVEKLINKRLYIIWK